MPLLRRIEAVGERGSEPETSEQELRILKHALKSFAARGYAGTSVRAIAADAQLTAPMVNYYFETKEALYQRLAEVVMDSLNGAVEASQAVDRGFRGSLLDIIETHVRFAQESPDAHAFLLGLVYGPEEDRPPVDLEPLHARAQACVRQVFERGIRSGEFILRPGVPLKDAIEAFEALREHLVLRAFKGGRAAGAARPALPIERLVRTLFEGVGTIAPPPSRRP